LTCIGGWDYYICTVLETPHVIIGAAIASKIPNPLLSIPLAFGSHFLLDLSPHWNPHLYKETKKYGKPSKKSTLIVVADALVSLAVGGFFAYQKMPDIRSAVIILLACFAAVLPDLIEAPFFFLKKRSPAIKKWIVFHRSMQFNTSLVPGIISQIALIIATLSWMG